MLFNKFNDNIKNNAISEIEFLEKEIESWLLSPVRKAQLDAERYYLDDHDIIHAKRQVIDDTGNLKDVNNLPDNHIVYNQFAKLVDQKNNYLTSKPMLFESENESLNKVLKKELNYRFRRLIKSACRESIQSGLSWIYPHYDGNQFKFKRFKASEILPFWGDDEHTELDAAIRFTTQTVYEGAEKETINRVEFITKTGIKHMIYKDGRLTLDLSNPHFDVDGSGFVWDIVPLIAFKSNELEVPLINRVKSLQDAINTILSNFMNNMEEDPRNTVLIVVNYDDEDPETLRKNIAQYGIVKVNTVDGVSGDVKTLTIEINAENYKAIIDVLKSAIIESGRGLDAKDDRLSGSPNQMNIQSMYSDLDLDANEMELEYQASFELLFWFLLHHLKNSGQGDYTNDVISVIFNRDILINESQAIADCKASVGVISSKTILEQHPWVKDVDEELKQIESESTIVDDYQENFIAEDGTENVEEE